jgi:acetyl-CoA acetyltransferase
MSTPSMKRSPRDAVIVGVGESDEVGEPRVGKSSLHLHAEAAVNAVKDAGIAKSSIDGVYTNESYLDYHVRHAMAFAEYFGIAATAKMITSIPLGSGASSGLFVHYAARAIRSGQCDTVIAVSGDNFFSGLRRSGAVQALADNRDKEFEVPYGPTLPACFGLVAQRHMYEYGTTPEQLAAVAVTMRAHAAAGDRGHKRTPITIADVLASKPVASPFTMLMCSLVSDGGAAVIVTTRERAEDLEKPYIEILGASVAYGSERAKRVHNSLSNSRDLLNIGTRTSARDAMGQAGVSHQDIDILMAYDCFAIMPILFLEAAGFCERGAGGAFFEEGKAMPSGELPVNTHGGMMSYAHPGNPGGLFMFVELVRQLRGELGRRQVPGAEVGMVAGYGGQMAFWPVTVLGQAR